MVERTRTQPLPDDPDVLKPAARKGRGAVGNEAGRFERETRERTADGWQESGAEEVPGADDEAWAPPPLRTTVGRDATRTIIARNESPDVPFDRSINPYRGCEHGCVYCFARPSHAYLGLSPGLDFESRLFAKHDAARLLEKELARPGYRAAPLALGANTDPYQPVERRLAITRQVLEVLSAARHPVTIVTKSDLVLRDLDLLAPMAAENLARVAVSVTTLEGRLARIMEPRAPRAEKRLAAIRGLADGGVPVSVLAAPMIPAINDHELEAILEAAAGAGADSAGYVLLRLPHEIGGLFEDWLDAHFPDRRKRVLDLVRETRGGALYDSRWRKRQTGEGPYAFMLNRRFEVACKRLGLNERERGRQVAATATWGLDCTRFTPPTPRGSQYDLL